MRTTRGRANLLRPLNDFIVPNYFQLTPCQINKRSAVNNHPIEDTHLELEIVSSRRVQIHMVQFEPMQPKEPGQPAAPPPRIPNLLAETTSLRATRNIKVGYGNQSIRCQKTIEEKPILSSAFPPRTYKRSGIQTDRFGQLGRKNWESLKERKTW
jgi:hypothetical protein